MALVNSIERNISQGKMKQNADKNVSSKTIAENILKGIPENFNIMCYTCNTTVLGKNLLEHLFFGRLDCKHCNVKANSCETFKKFYYNTSLSCKKSTSGKHEFVKWNNTCVEYLAYFLRKEIVIDRFCKKVVDPIPPNEIKNAVCLYLIKLGILENVLPWKLGFESCIVYNQNKVNKNSSVPNESGSDEPDENCVKTSSDISCEHLDSNNTNISTVTTSVEKSKSVCQETECSGVIDNQLVNCTSNSSGNSKEQTSKTVSKIDSHSQVAEGFIVEESSESGPTKKDSFLSQSNEPQHRDCGSDHHNEILYTKLNKEKRRSRVSDDSCLQMLPHQDDSDDPDEGILQTYNIEGLDQAVEYVTVKDGCREKSVLQYSDASHSSPHEVAEVQSNVERKLPDSPNSDASPSSPHEDAEVQSNAKRKVPDSPSISKLPSKYPKTHSQDTDGEFSPPDKIADGHYLVTHFPTQGCPEECPNCYCEFCPSMLTVNCSTFVSTIVCADCKLTIYVLPN